MNQTKDVFNLYTNIILMSTCLLTKEINRPAPTLPSTEMVKGWSGSGLHTRFGGDGGGEGDGGDVDGEGGGGDGGGEGDGDGGYVDGLVLFIVSTNSDSQHHQHISSISSINRIGSKKVNESESYKVRKSES